MTEDEAADGGHPPEESAADPGTAEEAAGGGRATGGEGQATEQADRSTEQADRSTDMDDDSTDMDDRSTEGDDRSTEGDRATAGDAGPTSPVRPPSALPPDRHVDAPIGAVEQASRVTSAEGSDVPEDVRKYDRFKKVDGAQYERVNEFLRERTYITAREWAIARLCSDFRTETGIEMTKIGENLPHLVPFMTDTYSPQAVNQARSSFETKVRKSGSTFLYGAMSDFFTADELDDLMYEVTEVAKFLLEVEGVDLAVEEELEGEERISSVMREVRSASDELRHDGTTCPNCGHEIGSGEHETGSGETETETGTETE